MKPATKKILIFGGIGVALVALWGTKKLRNLQYAFDNMTISQYGYPKNINVVGGLFSSNSKITFKMGVIFHNKSLEDFTLDGGVVARLKRMAFIYNGQTIGYANVDINFINVPAVGQTIIENIPIEIPTSNIFNNIANLADMVSKFSIIGYVDVLGTEYLIGS